MSDATQSTTGLRAFFDGLQKRLEHDVDNARENGLDVGALEEQGALNIGLARQTLADIAHNLADTEATRSARDNILAREAWPGRAELLKDYSEQLNKLELERLGTAVFVQWTIAQVRACQWEKMGAEYAIDRVVTPVIRGTDGQDPEAKETLRHIRQDPRKTDKFLAELRRAVDIKAAVDAHGAQSTAEHREHDTKLEGVATAVKKQRRDVAAICAENKLTQPHYLSSGMIADALQEALGISLVPNPASVKTVLIRRLAKAEAQGRLHPRIVGKNKAKYYLNDRKLFDEILSYCEESKIKKIKTDKDKEALAQVLLSTSKELSSATNSRP